MITLLILIYIDFIPDMKFDGESLDCTNPFKENKCRFPQQVKGFPREKWDLTKKNPVTNRGWKAGSYNS